MNRWKSMVGIVALLCATIVGVAPAQSPGKHQHGLEFMATALDLTDAQVAQVKQIHSGEHAQMRATHTQLRDLHEQFKTLVASDNFDEAKVQAVIAQIQQVQAAQMLEHARMMNAVYKILTPQQKVKAVKLFGSMHEGMGGMHGGDGAGGPQPPAQD